MYYNCMIPKTQDQGALQYLNCWVIGSTYTYDNRLPVIFNYAQKLQLNFFAITKEYNLWLFSLPGRVGLIFASLN